VRFRKRASTTSQRTCKDRHRARVAGKLTGISNASASGEQVAKWHVARRAIFGRMGRFWVPGNFRSQSQLAARGGAEIENGGFAPRPNVSVGAGGGVVGAGAPRPRKLWAGGTGRHEPCIRGANEIAQAAPLSRETFVPPCFFAARKTRKTKDKKVCQDRKCTCTQRRVRPVARSAFASRVEISNAASCPRHSAIEKGPTAVRQNHYPLRKIQICLSLRIRAILLYCCNHRFGAWVGVVRARLGGVLCHLGRFGFFGGANAAEKRARGLAFTSNSVRAYRLASRSFRF
jgi:hypothetical protein